MTDEDTCTLFELHDTFQELAEEAFHLATEHDARASANDGVSKGHERSAISGNCDRIAPDCGLLVTDGARLRVV